jgi:predicted transcriptional regulator
MAKRPDPLFELEATIMSVVWRHFPASARDVCDRLKGARARAYTTIMTTMDRLHKKGLLRREKEGLAWLYAPTMSEAEYKRALADGLADKLLAEHGEVGMLAMVEAASTDDALLQRLEEMIAKKKKRSGK